MEVFIKNPPCKPNDVLFVDSKNLISYLEYLDSSLSGSFIYSKKNNEDLNTKINSLSKIKDDCEAVNQRVSGHDLLLEGMKNSIDSYSNKLMKIDERFEQNELRMNGLLQIKESLEQKGRDIEKIIIMNNNLVEKIEVKK